MSDEVLLICGSFHQHSANRAALDVAKEYLQAAANIRVTQSVPLDSLVALSPALFDALPIAVQTFRSQLARADAVLIAGPEYAGGMSGSLKNALDWCVGSAEGFYAKPVAVMSAGTTGGGHALRQLMQTLLWQGAHVLDQLGIANPKAKSDDSGAIVDTATRSSIEQLSGELIGAISIDTEQRAAMTAEFARSAGIDYYPHMV